MPRRSRTRTKREPGTRSEGASDGQDRPPRPWLRRLTTVALVVAVFLGARAWQTRGTVDGPAPDLAGTGIDGEPLSVSALRGRPALVHFWATWCPTCRMMEGNVVGLAEDHAVLTVASQSGGAQAVRAYARREGIALPILVDPDGRLAALYGVHAFPTSFVLDAAGNVRHTEVGYSTGPGLRLRLWLAGL